MKSPFSFRNIVLATVGLGLIGGAVIAQTQPLPAIQWDVRRLDNLDRNVRRLERALLQRNNQVGEPMLVESDPELIALQGRVSQMDRRLQDMEQTVQRVNADLERLTFQLDESDRENGALRSRLSDADAHDLTIKALDSGVVCASKIPELLKEWREPRYPDFEPRTVWSYFNATTEVLKGALHLLPKRSQALYRLCDQYAAA